MNGTHLEADELTKCTWCIFFPREENAPGALRELRPRWIRSPSPMERVRERAAIAGVGYTEFTRNSGVSTLTLALRAIRRRSRIAGLAVGDVDGVATHRVGDSVPASDVAHALGISAISPSSSTLFGGGSASRSIVASAAIAVPPGIADYVVLLALVERALGVPHGRHRSRRAVDVIETSTRRRTGYCDAASAVRADRARGHATLRHAPREDWVGRDRAAPPGRRQSERAARQPIAAGPRAVPRVALRRRAAPPLRLLPRERMPRSRW